MVRYAGGLGYGDLVGEDGEAAVELDFVAVDDFAGVAGGNVNGELRFSGARGAHHDHHLFLRDHIHVVLHAVNGLKLE